MPAMQPKSVVPPVPAKAKAPNCDCVQGCAGPSPAGSCFEGKVLLQLGSSGTTAIAAAKLACRVKEMTVDERAGQPRPADTDVNPEEWREVCMVMHDPVRGAGHIHRLYRVDWLEAHHVIEGSILWLDLEHVGVRGEARVTAIEPCPLVEEGPGRLVMGTYRFSKGWLYELVVEGEPEPIGVTGTHPFWVVNRIAVGSCPGIAGRRLAGEHGWAEEGSVLDASRRAGAGL